jgi:hypothetical protein
MSRLNRALRDESVLWKDVNLGKFNVLRLRYDSGTKTTSFIAE